jgi:hypothetical protein
VNQRLLVAVRRLLVRVAAALLPVRPLARQRRVPLLAALRKRVQAELRRAALAVRALRALPKREAERQLWRSSC